MTPALNRIDLDNRIEDYDELGIMDPLEPKSFYKAKDKINSFKFGQTQSVNENMRDDRR